MSRKPGGDRLVMSPMGPLAAVGSGKAFERQALPRLDRLFKQKLRVMSVTSPARHSKRERA
jgi:hypothetical protein